MKPEAGSYSMACAICDAGPGELCRSGDRLWTYHVHICRRPETKPCPSCDKPMRRRRGPGGCFDCSEKARRARSKARAPIQAAVARALRLGELVRPDRCSYCGKLCKPDGHHRHGYDRENWLNVVWLCRSCHQAEHSAERAAS